VASIFSSKRALEALAALEQRDSGLRLTEIAEALSAPVSSTQVALVSLMDDGLVSIGTTRPPLYRIAPGRGEDAAKILDVASRCVGGERLLAAALRASRAVDFAARDEAGLLLVVRWDAEPPDEVLLARMLRRAGLEVARFGHDEVRQRLRDGPSLRERARGGRVIVGSLDRSFPDPFRHGSSDAAPLGRLHPAISPPSRSALSRIARRFGLAEIRVFGSAVHSDFRPDSDVDVLVRRKRGVRRTLENELSLRRALEDLLGRDVDVIDASVLRETIREKAESDGVVLFG
jgi:predicted nucleotidyltransferase